MKSSLPWGSWHLQDVDGDHWALCLCAVLFSNGCLKLQYPLFSYLTSLTLNHPTHFSMLSSVHLLFVWKTQMYRYLFQKKSNISYVLYTKKQIANPTTITTKKPHVYTRALAVVPYELSDYEFTHTVFTSWRTFYVFSLRFSFLPENVHVQGSTVVKNAHVTVPQSEAMGCLSCFLYLW